MNEHYKKRHRGPQAARRDKEISIRLTSAEAACVRAIAKSTGSNMADLIRTRLLSAGAVLEPVGRHPVAGKALSNKGDPELARQVARLGSNLNQIARAVNRQAGQASHIDVIKLLAIMLAIEQQVSQLCRPGATMG